MKRRIMSCFVMLVLFTLLAVAVSAATPITTAADLKNLMDSKSATVLSGDYYLTNDIDMSSVTGQSPIGEVKLRSNTSGVAFTGTFDGRGYAIRGLNIQSTASSGTGVGLFGHAQGATIENLTVYGTISNADTKGYGTGGIVGFATPLENETTTIRNCVNYCSVASTTDNGRSGGIVGAYILQYDSETYDANNSSVVIENCVNYGTITGRKHVGGILSRMEGRDGFRGTLTITGCANFGEIVATTGGDGYAGVLGTALVRNLDVIIKNCYNAGSVSGGYAVGGILGRLNAYVGNVYKGTVKISNCVNVGDLTATSTDTKTTGSVGGILGENNLVTSGATAEVTVENCFNSGALTNPAAKKANCGMVYGSNAIGAKFTCTTGNSYAAGTKATSGHHTTGAVSIAAANLGKASAYPATFNTDGTYLYSKDGPFMAAVHSEVIMLDGTDCVCALCGKQLLTTEQIGGETWIQIKTAKDLLLLMANSKAGNEDALGYNYILKANIDLMGDESQYPIGQPEASATSPKGAHFEGKFDGDGHTIKGIKLVDAGKNNSWGLFATIGGTNGNTVVIKDLTVEGTVTGYRFMGAIAGLVYGNFEISGCTTTANTTVTSTGGRTIGGVVGAAVYNVTAYKNGAPYYVTIENCINNATVHHPSADSRTGGIIGQFNTATTTEAHLALSNCVNNGKVTGGKDLGGVIGYLEPYLGSALVEDCVNNGTVTSTQNRVGGVIGLVYTEKNPVEVDIIGCENHGAVTSNLTTDNSYVAGILGWAVINRGATDLYMADSINTGKIVGKASGGRVAGIFGSIDTKVNLGTTVLVENCLNIGAIESATKRAAGIGGYVYTDGKDAIPVVVNCVNAGAIKAPADVGGIIALTNGGKLVDCINNGTVTATGANAGGITGWIAGVSTLENNLNMGTVTGGSVVNGIVGFLGDGTFTFTDNTYMAGTKTDANATSVTEAAAKDRLMNWCLTYGPNADSEDAANSDHYRAENGTKCLVCGAEKHSAHASNVTLRPEVVVEPTCVAPGLMYEVCPLCLVRGTESEVPVDEDNHDNGWNLNGAVAYFGCLREGCDHVEHALGDAIYVSANGNDEALGTANAPLKSFNFAMDIAAKAGKDIEIRLIGKVTPVARQINSEYNTFTNAFEEAPHTNTITITSAEGKNGEVAFTAELRRYFLYGPTTFENVKISCNSKNGVYIFGRGFKLVMGEGLTMVDVSGKTTSSKTDAGVSGLGAPATKTSDIKVYLFGGFYSEGKSDFDGLYEGADPTTYHSDLTVLSGEYWTIGLFNRYTDQGTRNMVPVPLENATGTLTVGDITTAYLCTVSSDSPLVVNNTAIDVHYVGAPTISWSYRHVMHPECNGEGNTINHIFYKDFDGAVIGDFAMGSSNIGVNINLVYAPEIANNALVRAFDVKGERYRFGDYAEQVSSETSLPEWCYANGGHNFVDNVCETCGIQKCTGNNHYYHWDLSGTIAKAICIAGYTPVEGGEPIIDCNHVVDGSTLDAIYVSDSGKPGAGLSANAPLHSYELAQAIAAKLGKDAHIYLVGTVTPYTNIESENNLLTNTANGSASFEEAAHDNVITVATAPGKSKATFKFTKDAHYYFLSGPTTFENVNIKASKAGTGKLVGDSTDSGGIVFAARGFHLTMGLGVAMPKVSKNMTYTKDDSGIDGLNSTTTVSDSKVYVWGGFQKNGYYEGVDADVAMSTSTEVTILSGTYWTIGGGNRGFGTAERNGMHVTLTVGDPTISTRVQTLYIVPFSSDSGVYTNCTADVHYTGRITAALNYRALFSDGHASSGNVVNHFFHKQYSGSKVGDFSVGTRAECAVNLYYATPVEHNEVVNGFRGKTTKFAVSYKQEGEEMSFPEWCVERGGGHDFVNDVCSFCEITPCKVHSADDWAVHTEATCNAPGLEARRCTVCFEHVEEREIPKDVNAHDAAWVYGDTAATFVCSICSKTLETVTYADLGTDGAVHVSAAGAADGDGTENAPVADFELAMKIAAAQTEDVTVYIHDMAIIPDSGSSATVNDFMEPAHTNRITVTSYGEDRATLRFNGDTPNNIALVYNVNGPTTFENLELSAWNATSRMYIAARHNDFVLGEGLTSDYQRGVDSGHAGTDIIVLGGCYGSSFNPVEGCENLDINLTVLSGSYGAIIGGAYYCKNCGVDTGDADIHLTLGGDVMVRRQLYAGSYGNSSNYAHTNDIYIDIVGDVTVASEFGFGPYGVQYTDDTKTTTTPYMAQNVYLKLYDGEIYGGSFYASNDPLHPYAIGAVMGGDASTARIAQKLYVYADGTSRDALAMYDLMLATLRGDERNDGKWVATLWEETYCHVNQGDHTPAGDAIDHADATCISEGYDLYNCSACGADYAEKIAMLDHVYGDAISIDATCIAPAMERETCTVCGGAKHTIVGNEFADHTDPEKTGFCQVCNLDLTVNCEHSFGEDVPFASGCGTGTKRTCDKCGKVEVEVYGDGHNYGKYVVTVEPTDTTAGIKTRTCKGCGKVETALLYATDAVNASAVATDAEGNLADFAVENSKLTKGERAALNALLQQDAYGAEVKISYETDGETITNITYSIPVPAEYTDYENVRIVVRDDDGKIHFVEFQIEKGYIVFTF